ncbi:hypothetical protein HDV00_011151 [Rhizophlyctis rosea]|nr:hypothetical protein HDV00_011151 [Rhizophlyctis rosea]
MYRPPVVKVQTPLSAGTASSEPAAPPSVPPGLSSSAVKFITNDGKSAWAKSSTDLREIKLGLLRFISTFNIVPGTLLVLERFKIYVIASADSDHEVLSAGEDGLKRHAKPNMEDQQVVETLYALYQGTGNVKNADTYRSPGTHALKNRVLSFLLRSAYAANQFPQMLQVAFDALYGEGTTPKLRAAGMSFVQWIARTASDAKITPIAPVLLSGLLKFINEGGNETGQEQESLRGFAYEAVGLLSRRATKLFTSDVSILLSFFKAVSTEERNVRVSVQEALVTMIEAYKDIGSDAQKQSELESVLLDNIGKVEHQARYAAIRYNNAIFPFTYPLARYICLLAAGDAKLEVRDEARRGLKFPDAPPAAAKPVEESNLLTTYRQSLPNFNAMVSLIAEMSRKSPANQIKLPGVRWVGGFTADSFTHALEFLRRLLLVRADPRADVEDFTYVSEEESRVMDPKTRAAVRGAVKSMWEESAAADKPSGLRLYLDLLELALKSDGADALLLSVASSCLLEIVSLGPSSLANSYSDRIDWLKSFLSSTKIDTRVSVAHIISIIASSDLNKGERARVFVSLLEEQIGVINDSSKQVTLEARHGSAVGLGFLIGRLRYRYPSTYESFVSKDLLQRATACIANELQGSSSITLIGACVALAEAGRYGSLITGENATTSMEVDSDSAEKPAQEKEKQEWTPTSIVEKLISLVRTAKDPKVQERGITTLGDLAVGDPSLIESVLTFFYTLPTTLTKQIEVHFTVGDAVCAVAASFASAHMEQHLDIADVEFPVEGTGEEGVVGRPKKEVLEKVLEKMLGEVNGGRPVARRAVGLWLLCVVKNCGKHSVVVAHALKIHEAFSKLLSDRDDFTQELASKGIGLVYEIGDQSTRDALVETLVSTFTEGRKIAPQTVTGDTQLFADNALGSSPDGGSISTYKSVLSLASDMNQPDLVYRFMSLASHSAIWNSRRGASMGFGHIAAQAEAELRPHLAKLIPRLYRYQFDPNQRVAETMKNIWKTLVKEPKKAVDEYFDVIITDVIKGMGDRQWRMREASCAALADLLHGQQITQLKPYLQDLWNMCFRALDDIKESVRNAAFLTCKGLTNITLRYCDPSVAPREEGQQVVDIVLPFFLTKGLGSMAEDVRKYSLSTILKISRKGGVFLRAHLAELVGTLLEGLSNFEPQIVNYLSFHTERYGLSQEELDTSRLASTRHSPMMDALESAVDQIDAESLPLLVSRLNSIIRKGIGLPTKAGSARFVCSLVQRIPLDLKPHADGILKALSGVVYDRSPVVRKANATAIGHICRVASEGAISRLLTHLKTSYLEGEDLEQRSVAGIVFLEISRHANDVLKAHYGEVLPIAFIGARDPEEELKKVWQNVWEENTAGSSGAIRLWQPELMDLTESLMSTTPSWGVKRQVAQAIGDIAKSLGSSFEGQMDRAVKIFVEALGGRTWEGKEKVVESFGTVCVEGREWLKGAGKGRVEEVVKILIREAKKNNRPYKRVSIEVLGKVLDALEVDRFGEVEEYLVETASGKEDEDDMDVDDSREKPLTLQIKANAFKAVGLCWPRNRDTQAKYVDQIVKVLAENVEGNVWNVRIGVLDAVEKVVEKTEDGGFSADHVKTLVTALFTALEDGKYTAIREAASRILKNLVLRAKRENLLDDAMQTELVGLCDTAIERESAGMIQETLKDVRKEVSGMDVS